MIMLKPVIHYLYDQSECQSQYALFYHRFDILAKNIFIMKQLKKPLNLHGLLQTFLISVFQAVLLIKDLSLHLCLQHSKV